MYSETPFVSIVILNRNGLGFAENCVRTVLSTNYPAVEVIFVDCASCDGSPELIEKMYGSDSRLCLIRLEKDLGAAEGRNHGARLAKGKYVAFIDNDILVDPNWLSPLINVLESNNEIGIAHALRIEQKGERVEGYSIDNFSSSYALIHGPESSNVIKVFLANQAMVIRNAVFFKVNMFDPFFFIGGEDTDLCWRVWLSGHAVVCVPASIVYHTKEKRYKPFEERVFYSIRNRMVTLIKNYELHNVVRYLSIFMITVVLGLIYFTTKRKINIVRNVGKALKSLMINFGYVWKQRLKVQSIRRVSDKQIQSLFTKSQWRLPLLDKRS